MSSVQLPPKPEATGLYKGDGSVDQEAMLKYQQKMADYNFVLQMKQQMQNEEQATRTNMAKSSHDAMMAVIGNMKA